MKKLIIASSIILFAFSCSKKSIEPIANDYRGKELRETGNYDYKTKASGYYSDSSIWMKLVSSVWVDAHNVPDVNNSIFIESGTTLTVDSNSYCKNLNINTTADIKRLITNTDTLFIKGKIRSYSGSAPGTNDETNSGVTKWITGKLCFTNTTNQTICTNHEFSANATNVGWDFIIDYPGAVASFSQAQLRCGNAIVKRGTLVITFNSSLRPSGNDSIVTGTIAGDMIVKSGAKLVAGRLYNSAADAMNSFTLESGATLEFNNTPAPILAAQTLNLYGDVIISGTTAEFPTGAGRNGSATIDTFYNLAVKDSVAKKLKNNVSVTGTYSLVSPATINFNSFTLTNP